MKFNQIEKGSWKSHSNRHSTGMWLHNIGFCHLNNRQTQIKENHTVYSAGTLHRRQTLSLNEKRNSIVGLHGFTDELKVTTKHFAVFLIPGSTKRKLTWWLQVRRLAKLAFYCRYLTGGSVGGATGRIGKGSTYLGIRPLRASDGMSTWPKSCVNLTHHMPI